MKAANKDQKDNKKTVYKDTSDNTENLTSGETSSLDELDRSDFTSKPKRRSKPMGTSHEPGGTPGSEF